MRVFFAILLGGAVSSLYALSTSLQALAARRSSTTTALRASLIEGLARNRLWLLGTVAGLIAWPLQAVALSLASVAVVQPALGLGLIVLLVLGVAVLHERVGPREIVAAAAITAAVGALGWAAPGSAPFTRAATWAIGIAVALAAATPHVLRVTGRAGGLATSIAAGLTWAVVGLATALIDSSLADRHWIPALLWGAGVAASSWAGLLDEMTALQTWPATRSIPVVFGLEMAVPAALAPVLTLREPSHLLSFGGALAVALAGAALLGSSRAVAHAAHPLTNP